MANSYYKVSSPIMLSLDRLDSTSIYYYLAFAVGYDSHVIKTYSITCYLLNYKSECLKVFNSKSWHRERTGKGNFISLSIFITSFIQIRPPSTWRHLIYSPNQ